MNQKTILFIGRSGSGKGTQAKLISDVLQKTSDIPVFYLETGARFREFIAQENYTSNLAKEVMMEHKLQPEFLAIHMWSHLFIDSLKGNEHILIDGSPRQADEAAILLGALRFYNRTPIDVVHLNVSRAWAEERLHERAKTGGRVDDKSNRDIEERMKWFEEKVQPAIEYFTRTSDVRVHDVHGERSIEEIHEDLKSRLI